MGVGVGYLQPEFEAVGADFANRGSVAEEHIEAMRALWAMDQPAFHGRRVQFEGVDAHPRPIQPGGPRLVMGGHSKPAFRRSVTMAHEWYGFGLDLAATEACLDGLRLAANQYERPAELGPLVVSVTPRGRLDRGAVESFAAIGIDRLIPMIRGADEPGIMADLDALDPAVLLA
jgi:alkanesulfonate monooxygenase SsuD/methylene tetrahydromethanopterin reductase-like flavin-dependent oxidoreductase (luciferase family)